MTSLQNEFTRRSTTFTRPSSPERREKYIESTLKKNQVSFRTTISNATFAPDNNLQFFQRQILSLENEINGLESLKNTNYTIEQRINLLNSADETNDNQTKAKKEQFDLDIFKISSEYNTIMQEKRDIEKETETIEEEVERLCEIFDSKNEMIEKIGMTVNHISSEIEELNQNNQAFVDQLDVLKTDVNSKLEENLVLKGQEKEFDRMISALAIQKEDLEMTIKDIGSTLKRTTQERFELDTILTLKMKYFNDLQNNFDFSSKDLEIRKDELMDLTIEINELNLNENNLMHDGLGFNNSKEDCLNDLNEMKKKKVQLISKIEEMTDTITYKQNTLHNKNENLNKIETAIKKMQLTKTISLQEQKKLNREFQNQKMLKLQVKQLIEGQKYLNGFISLSTHKNKLARSDNS